MTNIVIDKQGRELKTDVLLHPGKVLEKELESRGLKKSSFAMSIMMYPGHMSDILKGRRNITEDIALRLEKALDISAEFWMGLQIEYNLFVLRAKMNPAA
jgi:antitoxin HigA-1